jgi:hypothetical protein
MVVAYLKTDSRQSHKLGDRKSSISKMFIAGAKLTLFRKNKVSSVHSAE